MDLAVSITSLVPREFTAIVLAGFGAEYVVVVVVAVVVRQSNKLQSDSFH